MGTYEYIDIQTDAAVEKTRIAPYEVISMRGGVNHCVSLVSPSFFLVFLNNSQLCLQLSWGHVTSSGQWTVSEMRLLRNDVLSAFLYSLPWNTWNSHVPDGAATILRNTGQYTLNIKLCMRKIELIFLSLCDFVIFLLWQLHWLSRSRD